MQELAYRASRILRALGNPLRYRLLARLARLAATPGELARGLRRPLYVVSHHLAILRALDLVWYHPRENTHVYDLKYESLRALLAGVERCAGELRLADPDDVPCAAVRSVCDDPGPEGARRQPSP